jgi:hypothetical protein
MPKELLLIWGMNPAIIIEKSEESKNEYISAFMASLQDRNSKQ